ncbi:hypothetical protein MASR2M47_03640 [Draconibacterium sp.]
MSVICNFKMRLPNVPRHLEDSILAFINKYKRKPTREIRMNSKTVGSALDVSVADGKINK